MRHDSPLRRERQRLAVTKHGEGSWRARQRSSEWKTWSSAKSRAGMSGEWQTFPPFLARMGRRPPGACLLRIDLSKPFGPENAVWGTLECGCIVEANTGRRIRRRTGGGERNGLVAA